MIVSDNEDSPEQRAMVIIAGAMDQLTKFMTPIEVARLMAFHSVMGLTHLGGYEEVVTVLSKAVSQVTDARRRGV